MKTIFITAILIMAFLYGCAKESENKSQDLRFNKTLKEAVLSDLIYNDDLFRIIKNVSAESYFYYKNRNEIKSSLIINDSVKIEKFIAVLYKFQISGTEIFKSNWYMQIDGYYFPSYVSSYSTEDYFDSDNVALAKAMIDKCSNWVKKNNDTKWWKILK